MMHVCVCVRTYVCRLVCMYVCMYVCIDYKGLQLRTYTSLKDHTRGEKKRLPEGPEDRSRLRCKEEALGFRV